jgi:hypothetical protein
MYSNFKIIIDDSVLDYLKAKNKRVITLSINKSGGGCCPTFDVVDISLRVPSNIEMYNKYEDGNITIFISKLVIIKAPVLRFSLKKSLFFSNIIAVGLTLKDNQ